MKSNLFMRKIRNFLYFFICSFHLNCPTTEEQMLYFTIFCLFIGIILFLCYLNVRQSATDPALGTAMDRG